jgi:hypothetical protein
MNGDIVKVDFFLSKNSPKECKSKISGPVYVVDIQKIVRDLGYEFQELRPESEFILDLSIRKKILQGIYNYKGEGILVCHREMPENFETSLESLLEIEKFEIDYTISHI